ncbi:DUF3617 domain-containing protein [Sphingomonas montana]|uniref:DUF3617 domain-containing protein n=1 Tax=Sphingomonas montana TaxID=1843236 RepID=UPI00096D560C|nr:DUF3617 family protein [Sphingomonas montana]
MAHRPARPLLLSMLLLAPAALPAQPIAPGRWDVKSTGVDLVIPGTPAFMLRMLRGRSQTEKKCLLPAQAQGGIAALLVPKPDARCQVERAVAAGGRIDHVMLCPQKDGAPLRIVRAGIYTPAGFTLHMTMTGTTPKGPMRIVADQVATHAGPKCP